MLTTLSNEKLILNLRELIANERRITREILDHINEVERRRLYADLGFSTSFDWLTRSLGYSEAAAMRRISAARMIRALPETAAKIETGEINVTTLAQVHSVIRAEEKRVGAKMTTSAKAEIVSKVESCSSRETERRLAQMFPEGLAPKDVVTVLNDEEVRAHVTFTHAQMEKLKRVAELLSHRLVGANLAAVIEAAADELLKRKDPLLKKSKHVGQGSVATENKIDQIRPDEAGSPDDIFDRYRTGSNAKPRLRSRSSVTQRLAGAGSDSATVTANDRANKTADDTSYGSDNTMAFRNYGPNTAGAIPAAIRRAVFQRDRGQCTYQDDVGGPCCLRRTRIQIDHVVPRAAGGSNDIDNLRLLCQTHNLLMAEKWFGRTKIERFRSDK